MRTLEERFKTKVKFPQFNTDCWKWIGATGSNGYGQIWVKDHKEQAHRVAYFLFVGPITKETIDHTCRNKDCVNPRHLRQMSMLDNVIDGCKNLQKTHCPKGHLYDGDNLIKWKTFRYCRTCKQTKDREYHKQNKARINARKREAWRKACGK